MNDAPVRPSGAAATREARRPLCPQLEKILAVTGLPNLASVNSMVSSNFAETMLKGLPPQEPRSLAAEMKGAPPEAVDMVAKLLDFDPSKRLTWEQALDHPYMAPCAKRPRNPHRGRTHPPAPGRPL